MTPAGGGVLAALVDFAATVRRAGIGAGPDRVHALAMAVDALGPDQLYWAGRLTLCGCAEDLPAYDAAYQAWTGGGTTRASRSVVPVGVPRRYAVPFGMDHGGNGERAAVMPVATQASAHELLRQRDFSALTAAERDEIRRLLALLRPTGPRRTARRFRPAAGPGRVDPRRTMAHLLRSLGEPAGLRYRRHRDRPRRLVLLIDVSGSMAAYADALLRFAHAAVRVRPASTEVFTIGTRLARVTKALTYRDPDVALTAAGAVIPDWSGGTRLGDSIAAFVRRHAHPGLARGAIVVIFSDGWEVGDPAPLGEAVARLGRLAYRLLWVTPHRGRPGFAPVAGGLAAVLPHLDDLLAGHSLDALTTLSETLKQGA
jgi:uncharacterized protein with von Willebrand factor type A (vWA) domain